MELNDTLDFIVVKGDEKKQSKKSTAPKRPRNSKSKRIDADSYFMKIAAVIAERSTCERHHIGAIAVKDKRILATGYNGAPAGLQDCLELGCIRNVLGIPSGQRHEICRAVHAEQNVIIQAAIHGVSIEGATIYSTHTPCLLCAKMIVNAKIKRFVSYSRYVPDSYNASLDLVIFSDIFAQAGIETVQIAKPKPSIEYLD